ncbi:DnaJ C-terminal domain-containing protein [Aeoliella mucimassa]|nr:J domain-containing protein [Aeoliella mucimassa]
MAADPYQTLGVNRKATQEEINKAYRDLARKYHPDLHPDDESAKKKFQDVQAAFDILNDEKKRKMYDRYGAGFEQMGAGGAGPQGWPGSAARGGQYDFDFNELFGGGGGAPGMGGGFADLFRNFSRGAQGTAQPDVKRGQDLEYDLTIPFATAVKGGEASVSLRRGSTGKNETISVKIPAGIEDGKKIRLRGQGEPGHMGLPGDLLIKVRVAPHPYFKRSGKRLDIQLPVKLAEAVEGAKIDVPTPHGTVTISIPPGTSSGKKLRLRGQGVKPASGEPGDLYAEVQIILPDNMTEEERTKIAAIVQRDQRNPRADLRW